MKKQIAAKASYVYPAKAKSSLKSLGDSSWPIPKLSKIFFEIRSDLLKQPQLKEEGPLVEVTGEENPSIVETPIDLLIEEAEIFKKLDIPWIPDDEQDPTAGKPFDSDREKLQKSIKKYKQQMNYMQGVNDGLMMANRRLREDLQDVNDHF